MRDLKGSPLLNRGILSLLKRVCAIVPLQTRKNVAGAMDGRFLSSPERNRYQKWPIGLTNGIAERYRIRRMSERLAVKITQNVPQDPFKKELWNLATIIEEQLLSEMVQLDEAEGRPKKLRHNQCTFGGCLSLLFETFAAFCSNHLCVPMCPRFARRPQKSRAGENRRAHCGLAGSLLLYDVHNAAIHQARWRTSDDLIRFR